MNCSHKDTKIWEPHLAGARKCLICGMVYNPNCSPSWFYEKMPIEEQLRVAKRLIMRAAGNTMSADEWHTWYKEAMQLYSYGEADATYE